jgi:iron complex outermembrane receptor protein
LSIGAGWGSRAPTVTEAYGYYLNNTFDQYDYIGNPRLKNESAIELNVAYQLSILNFQLSTDINAFFFSNYIIGQFENRLSAMTVGAEGVKVYGNISHATIANASLTANYNMKVSKRSALNYRLSLGYAIGRDANGDALPLISPFSYDFRLAYDYQKLHVQAEVKGNTRQDTSGTTYGESPAAAWTVLNLSSQYQFSQFTLRVGIENVFDRLYATYADWNDIPQKGRNIFASLEFKI